MNKRWLAILELLNKEETLDVNKLSEMLNVSAVTVRKDLDALEKQGLLSRRHGQAMRVSPNDIGYRMIFDYDVKKKIAARAGKMVEYGETVMIESGSTCAMLAAEIAGNRRCSTIITNSAFISNHVRAIPGARVILLGGLCDPDAQVMTGPLVRKCAEEFNVDKFFIGTDGYYPEEGFFNNDMLRVEAVRAMAAQAAKCIIITTCEKFNRRGLVQLMPAHEVSFVITDALPENCKSSLEKNGVEIIIAE